MGNETSKMIQTCLYNNVFMLIQIPLFCSAINKEYSNLERANNSRIIIRWIWHWYDESNGRVSKSFWEIHDGETIIRHHYGSNN